MLLISVLNVEIAIMRLIGMCALLKTKNRKWFSYSQRLFLIQVVSIVTFFILIPLLSHFEASQEEGGLMNNMTSILSTQGWRRKAMAQEISSTIVTVTLIIMAALYERYLWAMVLVYRWRARKRFEETYNSLLVVDREILQIQPNALHVTRIRKCYLFRLMFLILMESSNIYDTFQSFSIERGITQRISSIIFSLVKNLMLNQFLTVFCTLTILTEALSQASDSIVNEQQLRKAHRALIVIIKTSKRANRTFDLQLNVSIVSGSLGILLTIFAVVSSFEKDGIESFNSIYFPRLIKETVKIFSIIFYTILVVSALKQAIKQAIAKLQAVVEREKLSTNVYLLVEKGFCENFTFTLQNYSTIDSMKTITKVGKLNINACVPSAFPATPLFF